MAFVIVLGSAPNAQAPQPRPVPSASQEAALKAELNALFGAHRYAEAIGTLAPGALQTVTTNPRIAATLIGGSLVSMLQRVTATNLGGTINLQTTIPTRN